MLKHHIDKNQYYPPMVCYKFWDLATKTMCPVLSLFYNKTEMVDSVFVLLDKKMDTKVSRTPGRHGHLIPSTGLYTKYGDELYFHDMVACKYLGHSKPMLLFWENGWRVMGSTAEEFATNLDKVYRIGNRWELPDLYIVYAKKIGKYVPVNKEKKEE